jgi:YrbI family 3-deoxy-D-manno-octulosonate 8-phosphate phosphatase
MIKLLILDIDGVMTDGTKLHDLDGFTMAKSFCDRDFTAIKLIKACGIQVCFLSGDTKVSESMAKNRNIDFFYSRGDEGMINKATFIPEFVDFYNCSPSEMAYVGDDIFDIPVMQAVGYSYCPKDSPEAVKDLVTEVINRKSGDNVISKLYEMWLYDGFTQEVSLEQVVELDKKESF